MRQKLITTFAIIFLLIFAGIIFHMNMNIEKRSINKWAQSNGQTVISYESHMTTIGTPFFWKPKNSFIWEVELSNGEKWWVRHGVFYDDHIKK